jgi:hypothetical protein
MRLIVLLPDDLAANVRRAVPRHVVVERHTVETLPAALGGGDRCRVVADPTLFREEVVEGLVDRVMRSGVAMTWYSRLSPAAAGRVLRFQADVGFECLLSDDDDPATLVRVIGQSPELSVPARVLGGVARRLERLPQDLATAVVSIFSWGPLDFTDHTFARSLGHGEAAIRSKLTSAGLASVGRMQRCARVARTYSALAERRQRLPVIAAAFGFGTDRTLAAHVREFTGYPPRRAVRALDPKAFAARLIAAIGTGD